MSTFEREYAKLNAAQAKAVDHIYGPLLVIAGPGTGKTQLLSLRVASILKQTDSSPNNILCLTFTNKAANNMRERLGSLIGAAGNQVPVRTFHSFAGELMQLYPDYFWNGARLTNVPEAVQLEIVTDILGSLPVDNPLALKFSGNFTATRDVLNSMKLAKEAGLTPARLRSLIELNQSYIEVVEPELIDICSERLSVKRLGELADRISTLPSQQTDALTRPLIALSTVIIEGFAAARQKDEGTNKTTHVSKWKSKWINTIDGQKGMFSERSRNAWWLALCDVYQNYREQLHGRGFYDYADMLVEVITQLERHPEMLAAVQEQYQFVLIDEFQDTNAAQLRLAHLIADHYMADGKPNIMAVGDDDQAIYKFNGAELSNMLGFRRSYPTAKIVVLGDNYRSTQTILDVSERVIAQASERVTTVEVDVNKVLTARMPAKQPSQVEHISYPTAVHQYHTIARKITDVFAHTGGTVAVLARGHDSLRAVAAILHKQGTPIRYERRESILDQEVVTQIILAATVADALQAGDNTRADQHISKLLAHPVWGISAESLWHLAIQSRSHSSWIDSMLADASEHIQQLAHWLLWLAQVSALQPLPRTLEYIIGLQASEHLTSPLRNHFLSNKQINSTYLSGLSATHKLLELARDFSRQGETTLTDFVRLIQVSRENDQSLIDESVFVSDPHAVELLTIHKAKGLEFDTVFIIDAMDVIWKPNLSGRKPPANLPLKPPGDDLDDYVRLMFVAITRAKQNVYITSYYSDDSGTAVLPSAIIRDLLPPKRIEISETAQSIDILETTLAWPRLETNKEQLLLKPMLASFSLSPTALLNFLDVTKGGPAYFLERHLLRLPEATSPRAAVGSALHSALEYAQQLVTSNSFELGPVLSRYETRLAETHLSPADHERYLLHGQQILKQLFESYHLQLLPTGRPEIKISNVFIGDARTNGTLDRIDIDTANNNVLITDYKTSTPLASLSTRDKTKQVKAWRHRTQLEFYVLLARASNQFKQHTFSTQMLYVEAETSKQLILSYTPSSTELDRLDRLLQIVWNRIITLNLPDVHHYDQTYAGIQAFEQDLLDGTL